MKPTPTTASASTCGSHTLTDINNTPGLPKDDDGPVFAEPWHAQVFAMTVELHQNGIFTWPEWAEALGARLKAAGPGDPPENYYTHWLTALERLLEKKGQVSRTERKTCVDAWDRAARSTPHGKPIVLARPED